MMYCPVCGSDSKSIETRANKHGNRRRRQCLKCGEKFTTQEVNIKLYGFHKMNQTKDLPKLAAALIREHLLYQHALDSVETDAQLEALQPDLMEEYRQAESNFLEVAKETKQHFFQVNFSGAGFCILCDRDFEEVECHLAVMLEAA